MRRLRSASRPPRPRPSPGVRPRVEPGSERERLRASLEAAGGRLAEIAAPSEAEIARVVPGFAGAHHVWSGLREIASRGVGADEAAPRALARLEFTLLAGQLAVAESGAVWNAPRSRQERLAALLARHLVLVVPETAIVAQLHDAYDRIDPAGTAFGWFLSGPSKTADIEQALVLGAQGPARMTLLLSSASER